MADKKVLTPEQEAILKSLTPEEVEQLKSLLGPDGKVDEAELAKVAGGKMSPKIKKILGWSGAALTAVGLITMYYQPWKRTSDNKAAPPSAPAQTTAPVPPSAPVPPPVAVPAPASYTDLVFSPVVLHPLQTKEELMEILTEPDPRK